MSLVSGCGTTRPWPDREGIVAQGGVHVVHVPGILGAQSHDRHLAWGLLQSGVQEIHLFDWTTPHALNNLSNTRLHREQAQRLADELRRIHKQFPDSRLAVTAHSGGTQVALLAIASLDSGEDFVEQLWLLNAAVRPDYDLDPIMERVDRVVAVSSQHDDFILGTGTSLFGTADRYFGDAAGRVGFTYSHPRFEQWDYDDRFAELGNMGDHVQGLNARFVMGVLGPDLVAGPGDATTRLAGEFGSPRFDGTRLAQQPSRSDATGQATSYAVEPMSIDPATATIVAP